VSKDTIVVPEQDRIVLVYDGERVIDVPGEHRIIEAYDDDFGQ
jgi:hypothetical protein